MDGGQSFPDAQELQRNLKRRISLNADEPQGVPEIVSVDILREYPRLIYRRIS